MKTKSGVVVPDPIIQRIEKGETRESNFAAGIQIAREAIAQIRGMVAGVQVSAPLGNVGRLWRSLPEMVFRTTFNVIFCHPLFKV